MAAFADLGRTYNITFLLPTLPNLTYVFLLELCSLSPKDLLKKAQAQRSSRRKPFRGETCSYEKAEGLASIISLLALVWRIS